jgi:hypothetical protein
MKEDFSEEFESSLKKFRPWAFYLTFCFLLAVAVPIFIQPAIVVGIRAKEFMLDIFQKITLE